MSARRSAALVWWVAPAWLLAAVLLGAWIVRARPLDLFGIVLGALAVAPIVWVLTSALWPGRAERRCPACAKDALARMDPHATHGLVCRACGWRDESASAWLLAEEEGPLEGTVLAERGRAPRRSPRTGAVDSSGPRG